MDTLETFEHATMVAGKPSDFRPRLHMALQVVVLLAAFLGGVALMLVRRQRLLAVAVGIAVVVSVAALAVRRDAFLPFLGYVALPPTLLKEGPVAPRNANVETSAIIDVPDGTRVLYWGAKSAEEVRDSPGAAYADFENAGVAVVKSNRATLRLQCPAKYRVPGPGVLDRHVHYRVVFGGGLIGPVHTLNVKC